MKVAGEYTFDAPQDIVWEALQDPEVLAAVMPGCEKLELVGEEMTDGAQKDAVFEAVTNIYEACGFQDITGQRISKVVNTLRHIETQVSMIVDAVGLEVGVSNLDSDKTDDEKLLNGPQMQSQAINQDDIDALLASFD